MLEFKQIELINDELDINGLSNLFIDNFSDPNLKMNKLKDVAGLLKAKITKDELEEALINATSQQNWQASTHILHEIANAAYNYEKWQQINDFIWDKLKKGKSWRKTLKTLSLVEFLLKNGPPSIISSFKYDIYQFRSFDNFSHYDDGIDRGESIREKAKVVVDLLSNEELLEEQRVKAKNIRERMSGVVSGSNYGGHTGNNGGSISGAKYGSIDNKSYQAGGFNSAPNFNDGGLGVYGDYGTAKSTLDKYKDNKPALNTSIIKKPATSINTPFVEQKKKDEAVVDNKKPFQSIAPKLVKPGAKPVPKVQTANKSQGNSNIIDDDILGGGSPIVQQPKVQQPAVQQQFVQQTTNVQPTSPVDLGFPFNTPSVQPQTTQPTQQFTHQPTQQFTQPQTFQHQPQALVTQPLYPPQNTAQNSFNMGFNNPSTFPQQTPVYGQQTPYGYGQQQGQFGMMGGYPQQPQQGIYGQQYQQPMGGYNAQNMPFGQAPQYQQPTTQFSQQPAWNQGISLSTPQTAPQNLGNISLATTTTQKKKQDEEFGNFSSGQNSNVKWLTSEQKGLIDFSDFGEELKGENKKQTNNNTNNTNNNIDTTWSW